MLSKTVLLVYVLTGCSQVYGEGAKFSKSHFHIMAPLDEVNSLRNLKISPFIDLGRFMGGRKSYIAHNLGKLSSFTNSDLFSRST